MERKITAENLDKKPTHEPVVELEFLEKTREAIYNEKVRSHFFEIHKKHKPKI